MPRLDVLLARNLGWSRTAARAALAAGRVRSTAGTVFEDPRTDVAELRPVGRLDLDTSGLLLWTTDGSWLQRLTHPKRAVPRSYQAALACPFQPPPRDLVLDDGQRPHIESLAPLDPADAHSALAIPADASAFATITITGGAYHDVRRIFAALGSHVLALCRVRFGKLQLPPDLAPGGYRLLSRDEV